MFKNLLTNEELNKCKKISLDVNEYLFKEGETCNSIYLLLNGDMVISSCDIDGKEDIYNFLKPGDMFANILVFASNNKYLGDAIALKKSVVLEIKKDYLLEILKTNDAFLNWFLNYNSNETMESKIKSKLLSRRAIRDRIIYYLNINGGEVNESVTMIAKKIMLNRVCVSRVITLLEEENIIKRNAKKIKLLKTF